MFSSQPQKWKNKIKLYVLILIEVIRTRSMSTSSKRKYQSAVTSKLAFCVDFRLYYIVFKTCTNLVYTI